MAAAVLDDVCSAVEVSGPGFINLTLSDEFVAGAGGRAVGRPAAGRRRRRPRPETVVDRLLGAQRGQGDARRAPAQHADRRRAGPGARVPRPRRAAREPHRRLGHALRHADRAPARRGRGRATPSPSACGTSTSSTPRRAVQFDSDPVFAERSRRRVVLLQSGDPETHAAVADLRGRVACATPSEVYDLLGVLLTAGGHRGGELLQPAAARGGRRARRARGCWSRTTARSASSPTGFENRHGDPLPLIVRKSDGGYGYPATDLAAVRDRTGPARRRPGSSTSSGPSSPCTCASSSPWPPWPATCPTASAAVHVAFGLVLGTDGKKLASRSGELRAPDRPADRGRSTGPPPP